MTKGSNDSFIFKLLFSKLFFIILFIIVVFLSFNIYKGLKQRMDVKKEISNLRMEINNLEKQNNGLSGLIEYFATDEYVESASREKLGYKKLGEKIVVLSEEGDDGALGFLEQGTNFTDHGLSNANLWWNYFFNKNYD